MRKTALERLSIDPSAIPILRSVWDFALSWLHVNKKAFTL